jgi:hypothetical protein
MDSDSGRATFVSVGDVLSSASKRCREVESGLRSVAWRADDPLSLACREIARQERELADLLGRFAREGPEKLLHTRLQYTPEASAPASPDSRKEALARVAELNHQLSENLDELARNIAPPELAEDLGELQREVASLARRMSMVSVTARDV